MCAHPYKKPCSNQHCALRVMASSWATATGRHSATHSRTCHGHALVPLSSLGHPFFAARSCAACARAAPQPCIPIRHVPYSTALYENVLYVGRWLLGRLASPRHCDIDGPRQVVPQGPSRRRSMLLPCFFHSFLQYILHLFYVPYGFSSTVVHTFSSRMCTYSIFYARG